MFFVLFSTAREKPQRSPSCFLKNTPPRLQRSFRRHPAALPRLGSGSASRSRSRRKERSSRKEKRARRAAPRRGLVFARDDGDNRNSAAPRRGRGAGRPPRSGSAGRQRLRREQEKQQQLLLFRRRRRPGCGCQGARLALPAGGELRRRRRRRGGAGCRGEGGEGGGEGPGERSGPRCPGGSGGSCSRRTGTRREHAQARSGPEPL